MVGHSLGELNRQIAGSKTAALSDMKIDCPLVASLGCRASEPYGIERERQVVVLHEQMPQERGELTACVVGPWLPGIARVQPRLMMSRDQHEGFDKGVSRSASEFGDHRNGAEEIHPARMQVQQQPKQCLKVSRWIKLCSLSLDRLAEPFQMRLSEVVLLESEFADASKETGRIPLLLFLEDDAFLDDGGLGLATLTAALFPVFFQSAAKPVCGAPFPVLLDRLKAEGVNVRQQFTILLVLF